MPVYPESIDLLRVMIASPGDMGRQRDTVERSIATWNRLHSGRQQCILQPLRWEYDVTPRVGTGDAQQVINKDLVERAHILVTLFGHRIGTATERAVSGTVEEINEALKRGLPVHVFFSRLPIPTDVDTKQLKGVRLYERELHSLGLVGHFRSNTKLDELTMRCLVADVDQLVGGSRSARTTPEGALLRVSMSPTGSGSAILVRNEGDQAAERLEFVAINHDTNEHVTFLNQATKISLPPGEAYQYRSPSRLPRGLKLTINLKWRDGGGSLRRSTLELSAP